MEILSRTEVAILGRFRVFSKLLRSKNWKWTSTTRSLLVHFQILESWKVGKLERLENMLLLLQPLWVTVLCLVQAKGYNDDRSAQAVQDEASLSPAATRAGFSMAPRPQVDNVHSSHTVAAMIRPPEVRMTAITREWLSWDDYSDKSEKEGIFQRKYSRMRCVPESTNIYCGSLSILYVYGTPVRSSVRKYVQTVPRHIKLSRAGMPFSKPLPQLLT